MSTIKAANIQNPSAASAAIVLDTSGNVNIDSNTLYVDATNNRVGIGTASPQTSLHVDGANTAARGQFVLEGAGADARMTFYRDADFIGHISGNTDHLDIATETGHHIEFSPAGSERVRIDTNGLKFNGDTAAANALDDYEEGTWTPELTFGNNSTGITYLIQAGSYTKVGNRVYYQCYFQIGNKGTATGLANVTGLPFAAQTGTFYSCTAMRLNNSNYGSTNPTGYIIPGQSKFVLERQDGSGTGVFNCDQTNFLNGTDLMLMGHYSVA